MVVGSVHEVEAAHVGGGHEARQIADRAAARAAAPSSCGRARPRAGDPSSARPRPASWRPRPPGPRSPSPRIPPPRRLAMTGAPCRPPDAGGQSAARPTPAADAPRASAPPTLPRAPALDHDGVRLGPEVDGDVHDRQSGRASAQGAMVRQVRRGRGGVDHRLTPECLRSEPAESVTWSGSSAAARRSCRAARSKA